MIICTIKITRAVLVFCDRGQKQCRPPPAIAEEGEKRSAVFYQVTGVGTSDVSNIYE